MNLKKDIIISIIHVKETLASFKAKSMSKIIYNHVSPQNISA